MKLSIDEMILMISPTKVSRDQSCQMTLSCFSTLQSHRYTPALKQRGYTVLLLPVFPSVLPCAGPGVKRIGLQQR